MIEYGGKADEGIIVIGIICGVVALILKHKRIREKGTVLFPKKSSEENKKTKSSRRDNCDNCANWGK